jgi:acyl-CoA reductase-like NAD-dependent aldehyde dehydrogenase
VLRKARALTAAHSQELAELSAKTRSRPVAEALAAEVLPLLDAIRFVERSAGSLLAPRKLGAKWRPLWLSAVRSEVRREPFGVILVIAPSNYPLFLPGVQVVQALAAGNAVLLKPAPGCRAVMTRWRDLLVHSGVPEDLLLILAEEKSEAESAIRAGVDKIFLTGSAQTGRAVLKAAAETITPVVAELSGCDAMLVCDDADLELITNALLFSLRLNDSATCIAPRRVYVARRIAERLEARLVSEAGKLPQKTSSAVLANRLEPLLDEAVGRGAGLLVGRGDRGALTLPIILGGVREGSQVLDEDLFAPMLSLVVYDHEAEAVESINRCSYALGASVFSTNQGRAQALAGELQVGVVTINDLITPTADPRLPFGGRRQSGFGLTRGAEGLIEMTCVKVITRTRGTSRPHYEPVGAEEAVFFAGYMQATHGGSWRERWRGFRELCRAASNIRTRNQS